MYYSQEVSNCVRCLVTITYTNSCYEAIQTPTYFAEVNWWFRIRLGDLETNVF